MASKGKVRVKMAMTMACNGNVRLSRLLPVIRNQRQAAWHHASRHTALIAPPRIYLDICIYLYSKLRLCTRTGAGQDRAPLSSHRKLLKVRKLCSQIILHDLQFALYLDRVTITQHGLIANLEQYRAVSSSVYHFIKQLHFPICSTIT